MSKILLRRILVKANRLLIYVGLIRKEIRRVEVLLNRLLARNRIASKYDWVEIE